MPLSNQLMINTVNIRVRMYLDLHTSIEPFVKGKSTIFSHGPYVSHYLFFISLSFIIYSLHVVLLSLSLIESLTFTESVFSCRPNADLVLFS